MTPLQLVKRATPPMLLTAALVLGGISMAGPAGAQQADESSYYDDDPGDEEFNFQTPFEGVQETATDPDPEPEPEVVEEPEAVVAGENNPLSPEPVAVDPPVVVAEVDAPAPAPAVDPVDLDTLPHTGAAARQMTFLGGLLLIAGGTASLISRCRRAPEAS